MNSTLLPPIQRSFRELSDAEVADIDNASALVRMGWTGSFGWTELLRSKRVLIVSEAGAGKTYECQAQQAVLTNAGEAAFFLDLATLAISPVRDMLSAEEEERFDAWLRSQSEVATFFLDSIDELKLTHGKFEQALKRLNKALAGQLGRVRVIITTRPVPIDRELIVQYLPIPMSRKAEPTAEAFADMVMDRGNKKQTKDDGAKPWRNVGLMPLSREQMREFAVHQGIEDADALLADIFHRDAEEFAERPQDLVELCSDWREHRRIRSHREQVEANIATKLKPRAERKERAELSQQKATDGASRLALAALLTRKLTLRYSDDADIVHASQPALDVSKVLQDWSAETCATLLERPLFGYASYGRVRFHHRSVVEFLAAHRLDSWMATGRSAKSIKRLLFTETAQGLRAVRPTMRAVAAWLASSRDTVFDELVCVDPSVLLDHGDPQSLRPAQRIRALEAYVDRYCHGGWRGLNTPSIQVRRFASVELTDAVNRLWTQGIENPEVRHLLLELIAAGTLKGCADIAYATAMDGALKDVERGLAIEALLQIRDPRLDELSASIETDHTRWPDAAARRAMPPLFPTDMPVARFSAILRRVGGQRRSGNEFNYRLLRKIEEVSLSPEYLDGLRQSLTDLIVGEISWAPDRFPHLQTLRPELISFLLTACRRQATSGIRSESWIRSTLLAVRLSADDHDETGAATELRHELSTLPSEVREAAFWDEHSFLATRHKFRDAWDNVYELSHHGGIYLDAGKDGDWVRKRLSNPSEPLANREMMLWAEMVLLKRDVPDHNKQLESLKTLVSDAPRLTEILEQRLKQADDTELRRMEMENARNNRKSRRRTDEAHASWANFWREVARDPDGVLSAVRANSTAWDLWQAMDRSGQESRASGWNRRFIEEQFGRAVADRLREVMMAAWRKDKPTLSSERPADARNTFPVRWQFGLAGIGAEAEDLNWAKRLSEPEVELACRYAPIELNGFPSWMERLAVEHPTIVDRVLGEELNRSLREAEADDQYSIFLQNIRHAPEIVSAVFLPRIRTWVTQVTEGDPGIGDRRHAQNLRQAIGILLRNGNDDDRRLIENIANSRLSNELQAGLATLWLSTLLQLNPAAGVEAFEIRLNHPPAADIDTGLQLFAQLFDRGCGSPVDLRAPGFTPALLLRLLRLAYRHVRVDDDVEHEGSYTPDTRDDAERGRNALLSALLSTTGSEGWAVKLEMTADPLFHDIKDRIMALARETAAEEADGAALSETEFSILDTTGESAPATAEAMFALMRDRLDDIDDLLLQDISPRELWASITDEHVMRRELARALRESANQCYTVDQESVTADEKETDIRLRSTRSKQQGIIELKLGDERSGMDLFNTLREQLLTKYMASDECRAGCLLVTIARDRRWEHPKTGQKIGFEDLLSLLSEEAQRLSAELGGSAKLMAKGLDLRPRLPTEKTLRGAPDPNVA